MPENEFWWMLDIGLRERNNPKNVLYRDPYLVEHIIDDEIRKFKGLPNPPEGQRFGEKKGSAEIREKIIRHLLRNGQTLDEISKFTDIPRGSSFSDSRTTVDIYHGRILMDEIRKDPKSPLKMMLPEAEI